MATDSPLTVQELMAKLAQLPPDLPIFVEGYENGWDPVITVEPGSAQPSSPVEDWDGEVERTKSTSAAPPNAIFLIGRRGHRRQKRE
jgi:hypothetical protein